MSKEQFDIVDEDGATIYRHRPTGFLGAVHHGDLCAGMGVTVRPGRGDLARMVASTALLGFEGAEFLVLDRQGVQPISRWIVGYAKDGVTPAFKPIGRQLVGGVAGSIGHFIQQVAPGTSFAAQLAFPAALFSPGMRLMPRLRMRKTGTNATATVTVNLGTAGNATDALLWSGTMASASPPREIICNTVCDIYDATTITTEAASIVNGDQAAVSADVTSNFNCASAMKLTVNTSGNASDTLTLENIALYLEAF